ncbi:MAG: 4-aminobutyrate--2-oxoglutarate transaminase [Burkholderiaceae bacterium]
MSDWIERKHKACPNGVSLVTEVVAARAVGSEIWDEDGRRYIDFVGGIGVMNTGHGHPKVSAAIRTQLDRFVHTCFQVVPYTGYIKLAERLNQLAPGRFEKKTLLMSTGAEAVENAVKIARAASRRPAVIAFDGAFHGRTLMTLSLTGKVHPYKAGFGPMPGPVFRVPFPARGVSVQAALEGLAQRFKCDVDPRQVAAVIVEAVQGEGGFHPAPAEFMRGLRQACDEHGILLIVDEIQSGFGRTGKLFAMEHYDVAADLVTVAKSLAAGLPLSAVIGRANVMDGAAAGGLGSTYAGNPLAVASAHAVIDIFEQEGLAERGAVLGERLVARLEAARRRYPVISDVRGLGAMIAMEFADERGQLASDLAQRVRQAALARGLILLTCGQYANAIRFLFPLTTSDVVFDEALDILDAAFDDVLQREEIPA